MVISRLVGGLGNQMFQYATGLAVAKNRHTNLLIDISEFEDRYKLHKYSLNHHLISARPAYWFDKALNHIFGKTIVENQQKFNQSLFNQKGNLYLSGYWQSEKYFLNIRDVVTREFSLRNKPDGLNISFADKINRCNSISLHIRRADYITNKKTLEKHGICNLDYYSRAVKKISSTVSDLTFFIFSDDKEWVKKNLKIQYKTEFMTHNNADKNYLDLWLMSQCKHNIIANSSFSWWGAWLNNNKNKIVIAPRRWFNDLSVNTADLIPQKWVRM